MLYGPGMGPRRRAAPGAASRWRMRPNLGSAFKIALVLFWAVMVFLLIQRVDLAPEIVLEPSEELSDSEAWMSVFFKGQKVGYTEQSLARTEFGYDLVQNAYLKLNLMGTTQELRTMTSARLNEAMELMSFSFFMSAGPVRYQLSGVLDGLTLDMISTTGGHTGNSQLRLESPPRLASGLMPYLARQGLEEGDRFQLPIFDPATLSMKKVTVAVEGLETLLMDGRETQAFRLRMDYRDTQTYTWIDPEGRTIKEEGFFGLSLVRATEEEAKADLTGRADLADMVASTSATTDKSIKRPREARRLKARLVGVNLEGFELDGGRQTLTGDVIEVVREKIDVRDQKRRPFHDPDLDPYLEPEALIQSRHPKIIAQARSLAGGVGEPLEIIDRVVNWTYENLEKRPTMSVPSAVDVLETKVGDCNEHAVLAAALLRAAGVPTRVAVGVLYYDGRFYYHAWLEAYWGRWLAVDPVVGQVPADATHIRFMTGGLARQSEMIRLIGRLRVEILEVE